MTLAPEEFADRRRLRRRASFWRVAAIVAGALFVIALIYRASVPGVGVAAPHIARVNVSGVIANDEPMMRLLDTIAERDTVRAVVVHVDSPGGTAVGGEALFAKLREIAGEKPLVAQVETLAASAGYMVAAAADHIVARNTSIVGSIGVIVQVPQVAGLLDKIGVEVREIKSAPLKAEPSPFNETTPAEEAMIRRMVNSSFNWFVDLVTDRRPLSRADVLRVADGSVFSGLQALELRLVDALGGEEVAQAWLESERDVEADLTIRDWRVRSGGVPFGLSGLAAPFAGESALVEELRAVRKLVPERLFLDGMIAIWQK